MNADRSLNFSDLIAKFSTNATPKESAETPAKPVALRIHHLHIAGARASLTDLTTHTPFRRAVGPLDVTLEDFQTDPVSKNPYSFSGTSDAGEKISWSGYFYLDPLRSRGELSLEHLSLNKYVAVYQDLVRFEIRDGVADLRAGYQIDFSPTNRVAIVTNASFALHSFKLAEPGREVNIVDLPEFSITGVNVDVNARRAQVASVSLAGATLFLQRDQSNAVNVVQLSQPAETAANAPGGVLLLLQSITNAVALLLNSTNAWTATLHEATIRNCALNLEDLANPRPARLNLEGSIDPDTDLDGLRQAALEKQLRTEKWQSLRKSARASTTPDQVTLEPDERASFIKQLYREALSKRTITAATNTVKRAGPGDPMELALRNSMTVGDSDFAALAADRAKAVRAYLLQTGKVEADRVFLTETQPGGVKTQGSRAYLQLR